LNTHRLSIDRFDSREAPEEWASDPFNDGAAARIDGQPRSSAPPAGGWASGIGEFARRSWLAGWDDTDAGIAAEEEAARMGQKEVAPR
jgi:hypothetical protein